MKISNLIEKYLFIFPRIIKYQWLSNCQRVKGKPILISPVLKNGKGSITFGKNVQLGVKNSPLFFTHYSYIEARKTSAKIIFGDNISINNNASIVAEKSQIIIDNDVLIGSNCSISDSDFHPLNPSKRNLNSNKCKQVRIEKNVFIGNNVTILKGSVIGKNSVVAAGAVVSGIFPKNVVIGGVPAKIIKSLDV